MTTPWWDGLGRVEQVIDCAGKRHRLVWEDGELGTADHPDADRERALVALGADPYPCLDLATCWERHRDDLDVLVLASRGAGDRLPGRAQPREDDGGQFFSPLQRGRYGAYASHLTISSMSGWTSYSPHDLSMRPGHRDDLADLLALGGELPDRLVASVVAAWSDRIEAHDPRVEGAHAQLRAAVYGRIVAAVRNWTDDPVGVELVEPGDDVFVARTSDGIRIAVPFRWLGEVWARGLTMTMGRLCLSAEQLGDEAWRLDTVGADLATTRTMTVTLG